jgi:hypothetical protein
LENVKKMQRKRLTEMNLPPPPPLAKGRSQKKLIAIVAIVIIVAAAIAGAYYLINNSSSANPSPSPSSSQTPGQSSSPGTSTNPLSSPGISTNPSFSPGTSTNPSSSSSASPTATPSSTASGQFAGYRAGAWANYTSKSYDANGVVTGQSALSYAVSEETRNGVACWVLVSESEMSQEDVMKITYWVSKSNPDSIHIRSQMFSDGVIVSDTESDLDASDFDLGLPTTVDSSIVVGQETVTVPAGTFNCEKYTATMTFYGITSVSSRWVSSSVPILGLVKDQSTEEGVLKSTTELIAYGG